MDKRSAWIRKWYDSSDLTVNDNNQTGAGICYSGIWYLLSAILLQRRLLYRLPRTTRGSRPLNINHPHSDSSSHHSSYLGLTDHPHLQLIYTHTYKPLTHTRTPCKVLICPGCLFWALYPCLISVYLTLDRFLLFWLFSACPVFASRLPWPSTWYSTFSLSNPCCSAYLTLCCLTILIKSCKWIETLLTHHYTFLVFFTLICNILYIEYWLIVVYQT